MMALPQRQQRQEAVYGSPYQTSIPNGGPVSGAGYGVVEYRSNGQYGKYMARLPTILGSAKHVNHERATSAGMGAPGMGAPVVMASYPVAGACPG
jgi:hypothetical protein